MAHEGNPESRLSGRTWANRVLASRALTWPAAGARQAWGVARPHAEFLLSTKIRKWAAEEAVGRLFPWFAVAYGFGIVLYFTAEREPALWAAIALAIGCTAAAVALRRHHVGFVVALGVCAMAVGFAAATMKTALMAHPVLRFPASGVTISGFVELREESQHTDRFVLRIEQMEGGRMDEKPQRVRLSVKRGTAPPAGAFVQVKAMLDPPLQPLAPGSYDFARDLFFQGIGASPASSAAVSPFSRRRTRKVCCSARMHPCRTCATPSMRGSAPCSAAILVRSPPC